MEGLPEDPEASGQIEKNLSNQSVRDWFWNFFDLNAKKPNPQEMKNAIDQKLIPSIDDFKKLTGEKIREFNNNQFAKWQIEHPFYKIKHKR